MITKEQLDQIATDNQFGVGNGVILNLSFNPYITGHNIMNNFDMIISNTVLNKNEFNDFYKNIITELESLLNQQLSLEQKIEAGGFLPEGISNLDQYLSALVGKKEESTLIGKIDNSKRQKTQLNEILKRGEKIRKDAAKIFQQKRVDLKNAADTYTKQSTLLVETIRKINAAQDISEEAKEEMLSNIKIGLYNLEQRKQMVDDFQQKFLEHGGSSTTFGNLFYDPTAKQGLIDLSEIDKVQEFLEVHQNYFNKFGKSHYSHITKGNKELVDAAGEVLKKQNAALAKIKETHTKIVQAVAKGFFKWLQSSDSTRNTRDGIILNWGKNLYRELSSSQLGYGKEGIFQMGAELLHQNQQPIVIASSNDIQKTINNTNLLEGETGVIFGVIPDIRRNVQQGVYEQLKDKEEEAKSVKSIIGDYQRAITRQESIIEHLENNIYKENKSKDIEKLQEERKKLEKLLRDRENDLIKSQEGHKQLLGTKTQPVKDKVDNAHYLSNGKETIVFAFSDKAKEGIYYSGIEYNSGTMLSNMDLLNTLDQKEKIMQAMLNLSEASVFNSPTPRKVLNEFIENTLTSNFMQFMFNNINYQDYLKNLANNGVIPSFQQGNVLYVFRASGRNAPASRILSPIIKSLKAKINNKKAYEDILKAEVIYSPLTASKLWGDVRDHYKENKAASWAYVANAVAATTNINMEIDMAQLDALYSF